MIPPLVGLVETASRCQREIYGLDPEQLSGEHRRAYIATMLAALHAEVVELGDEFPYRWWQEPSDIDDVAVSLEAADVLLFLANLCAVAGVDDSMLFGALQAKIAENAGRHLPIGGST